MAGEFNKFHNYELILNQAPCGMGIFQIETGMPVFLNDAYFSIIGYSREEYAKELNGEGKNLIYDPDMKISDQIQQDFLEQRASQEYEYRIVRKNGEIRWVKLGLDQVMINDEEYAFASFVDFTEENEAYSRLNTITENMTCSLSMFKMTEKGEELYYANPAFYRLIGVEPKLYDQDPLGYDCSLVSSEDYKRIQDAIWISLKNDTPGMLEYRCCRPDGKVLWISRRFVVVKQETEDEFLLISVMNDITEQKLLSIKEAIDKERFGLVIDELNAAVFEWNLQDGSFYSSEAYQNYAVSRVSTDDILNNRGPMDIVYENDREIMQQFIEETNSGKEKVEVTLRLKMVDGSFHWCRMLGLYYRGEDGKPTRTIGMVMDINEERERSFMLDSLLNGLPGGVAIFKYGKELECQYFSDGFAKLSGRTRADVRMLLKKGTLFEETIAPSDIARFRQEVNARVLAGEPINLVYQYTIRDKGIGWLHMTATKLREEDGDPVYYCIFTNPTEEAALYRSIVEDSTTGVFVADRRNRRILYMNERMGELLGLSQTQLKQRVAHASMLSDDYTVLSDQDVLSLKENSYTEFHVEWKDEQHFAVNAKAVNWNGVDAYILYFTDETAEYKQQKELQKLIDEVPGGIGIYEIKNGEVSLDYVNDAYYRLLGMDRESRAQYQGTSAIEAVHPDDREKFMDAIKEIMAGANSVNILHRVRNKDGKWIWLNYAAAVVERREDYQKLYVSFTDCNDMMIAQQEREQHYEEQLHLKKIAAQEALATATFNLTKNLVTEADSSRPELSRIMQHTCADKMLEDIRKNTVKREEKEKFITVYDVKTMLQTFADGTSHIEIRHHLKTSPGWVQSTFDIIQNPYTGDVEAIATLRDISDTVRAELVVNRLLTVDYEAILTIDKNTGKARAFRHEKTDPIMRDLLHILDTEESVVSGVKKFHMKYAVPEDRDRAIRENSPNFVIAALSHAPVHVSLFTLQADQRTAHKRIMYSYLDESQDTILCAVQDVTHTYEQEEKQKEDMAKALMAAERANQSKRDFLARMSHDMRTPMNGIIGVADLSVQESDPAVLQENMSMIKSSGEYLLSLINDTLDFQKIESGKMTLHKQIAHTVPIFHNIIDMIKPAAQEKGIHLNIMNHNADMNWYIRIDTVRIKQIIFNLLSNAVKFTPSGGTVSMEIWNLSRIGAISHNCIKISDTGIGMSKEFMEHELYKPFSQEQSKVSTQYAGSGLGLSIVHSLVEMMGGRMEVESQQGVGTTFTLYLDFERVDEKEAQKVMEEAQSKAFVLEEELKGKKILLVEDHPLNAQIAIRLLEKAGCQADWADNGEKGVEAFHASQLSYYDAILMDIRMPVMDGLEAAETIRRLDRTDAGTVPIIAMTANAYDEDSQKSIAAGMNAHLVKPIVPSMLYETLANYIKLKREQG